MLFNSPVYGTTELSLLVEVRYFHEWFLYGLRIKLIKNAIFGCHQNSTMLLLVDAELECHKNECASYRGCERGDVKIEISCGLSFISCQVLHPIINFCLDVCKIFPNHNISNTKQDLSYLDFH